MASSTSLEVVISRPPGMVMVEAYTDSSLPAFGAGATTASCSTKPRSVCTGPPWKTGVVARSSRSSGRSTFSNRFFSLMSLGLLITRPRAPRALCSHR
jgi:hypothetical protein